MRLYELNTNPQPSGGQCVLCGGSVRFVIDTDKEPVYRYVTFVEYTREWEMMNGDHVPHPTRPGYLVEIRNTDELCRPCADGHPHRCMGGDCATERRRKRFDGIGGDDDAV